MKLDGPERAVLIGIAIFCFWCLGSILGPYDIPVWKVFFVPLLSWLAVQGLLNGIRGHTGRRFRKALQPPPQLD